MLNVPKIEVGSNVTVQRTVQKEDTALNYGSGKLEKLFATPSLVALMIEASVKLLDDKLPEGFITVGKKAEIVHEKTTVLGETISVNVEVDKFDGNKINLNMTAYDEIGIIGRGAHERIIVNKNALLEKAQKRAKQLENMDF
ncbi:thioesterase family protein [Wukongibacter sp. M2B1]|uniref:thioesterase family protein n=1 Tax=Wukongibacter sp. M2B1 TaxID=3088895 RepID=UPI003D7AE6BA